MQTQTTWIFLANASLVNCRPASATSPGCYLCKLTYPLLFKTESMAKITGFYINERLQMFIVLVLGLSIAEQRHFWPYSCYHRKAGNATDA